jgi:hypothetical protein
VAAQREAAGGGGDRDCLNILESVRQLTMWTTLEMGHGEEKEEDKTGKLEVRGL